MSTRAALVSIQALSADPLASATCCSRRARRSFADSAGLAIAVPELDDSTEGLVACAARRGPASIPNSTAKPNIRVFTIECAAPRDLSLKKLQHNLSVEVGRGKLKIFIAAISATSGSSSGEFIGPPVHLRTDWRSLRATPDGPIDPISR